MLSTRQPIDSRGVIRAIGTLETAGIVWNHRGHGGTTENIYPGLSASIIGAAMKVHSSLGPGLLESAYESCLCHELHKAGIAFERQVSLPLSYDGLKLDCGFRLDLLVERRVVVEVKSIERLGPVHDAQLLTYLRVSKCKLGLLLNFNVSHLRHGIRRLVL